MNEGNICSDLEVKSIPVKGAVAFMYKRQYLLQERLHKLPPKDASIQDLVTSLIYWRHCIHSECDELVEWFAHPSVHKQELEMEVIDILHFVFNLGISLGFSVQVLDEYYKEDYTYKCADKAIDLDAVRAAICNLSSLLTDLIDLLPWKTWKTYDGYEINHKAVEKAFFKVIGGTFLIAIAIRMPFERTIACYIAKNDENHARQDRGY